MTLALRAFVMIRNSQRGWSVEVCRDMDAVLDVWSRRAEGATGVLHVGFDRPASILFDEIANRFVGRMLLTGAAKHALPRGFESSSRSIGHVENLPLFIGTRGWGYIAEDPVEIEEVSPSPAAREPDGWVKAFFEQNTDVTSKVRGVGIVDESSYLAKETALGHDERYRLGIFRYRSLIKPNATEPCDIVRAAPPWLLNRPFSEIDLSVRVANAFVTKNIREVKDLLDFDTDKLLKIQNFGRKSVRDLHDALLNALNEGPRRAIPDAGNEASTLIEEIEKSLASLDTRERDVLVRRMGFRIPSATLQAISDGYLITRERVRQIEEKALAKFSKTAFWSDILVSKLESLLLGRDFPLPVLGLEAVDRWFKEIGHLVETLAYILSYVGDDRCAIVRIDGVEYVGRLDQNSWEFAVREARKLLAAGVAENWTESHCRSLVGALLADARREFRPLLWQHATMHCHFVDSPDSSRRLVSYGRGADQVVEAVLMDAAEPLHFSEIARRASERSGRDFDIRRAHNAAASIGILLGRGTYGLDHHLRLSPEQSEAIQTELEQIILDDPNDRQWHSSELVTIAVERGLPAADILDKYRVDAVLRKSQVVQCLGRMIWTKSVSRLGSRIDVHQAVASLLEAAGKALTINEIKQRLIAVRGVSDHFQINSSDLLVRVDAERWGLNDRDISLKRDQQGTLLGYMAKAMLTKQQGVHISEIIGFVAPALNDTHVSAETIFSLASQDSRFQSNVSQYLFLREWGDARRETLPVATLQVLQRANGPLSLAAVVDAVQARTQRALDKRTVLSCLIACNASVEATSELWSMPASRSDEAFKGEDDENLDDFATETQPDSPSLIAPINWGMRDPT